MKTLSIRQPWAWLIVNGHKDIENRTWNTNIRGDILIHAALKFDEDGYNAVKKLFPDIILPKRDEFEYGGIVGQANLVDCVTESASEWFGGPYGYVLADARTLPFQPRKGKLGFFNTIVSKEIIR